jgi:hypothetical protein
MDQRVPILSEMFFSFHPPRFSKIVNLLPIIPGNEFSRDFKSLNRAEDESGLMTGIGGPFGELNGKFRHI